MIDLDDFDDILNLNDPAFLEKFKKAASIEPGDTIKISTPQFDRTDGVVPIKNPAGVWNKLRDMPPATLKELGLLPWSEPEDGKQLWLFPWDWYHSIPLDFEIVDINGNTEKFKPGETDNDKRFGCLAYGIEIETE